MDSGTAERKDWMGLLARAPEGRIAGLMADAGLAGDTTWLRPPEVGSVMVRGRTGGTGAAFNLGEMTVTRCSLKLACGSVGHAYVQGRRKDDAGAAALVDALMQTDRADQVADAVLVPLQAEEVERKAARAAKAASTRVEFFTMVRGEDA